MIFIIDPFERGHCFVRKFSPRRIKGSSNVSRLGIVSRFSTRRILAVRATIDAHEESGHQADTPLSLYPRGTRYPGFLEIAL